MLSFFLFFEETMDLDIKYILHIIDSLDINDFDGLTDPIKPIIPFLVTLRRAVS